MSDVQEQELAVEAVEGAEAAAVDAVVTVDGEVVEGTVEETVDADVAEDAPVTEDAPAEEAAPEAAPAVEAPVDADEAVEAPAEEDAEEAK